MHYVPYVIEDTGRGERAMDIYSRLLKDRIVFIGSEITTDLANSVIAQLLFLRAEEGNKEISIYINSPGGEITAGLAIYDTMKFMSYPIHTYCLGQAASMAALLLAAGTRRYALPQSRLMIHQPLGGVLGSSSDVRIQVREISTLKDICTQILAKATRQSIEKISADVDRDFHMSAEEALAYGLIDEIARE